MIYKSAKKSSASFIGISRDYEPPRRSLLEEIGNSVTHGLGSAFAVLAAVLMYLSSDGALELIGASVYSVGLFLMFTVSCLYHAFRHGTAVKRVFHRLDYSCIYLLIGATFAPILISYIGGTVGYSFLIVQWCVIAFGVTLVSVFGPNSFKGLHVALYLILGWSGLTFIPDMYANGDYSFLLWILSGGVVYSLGIIPFAIRKGTSHFIWHFFVLAGAVVQWLGIYTEIYLK